jgi:vesicle-fusing ATPase
MSLTLKTCNIPIQKLAYTNFAYVNPSDYELFGKKEPKIIKNSKGFILNLKKENSVDKGFISMNQILRIYHQLSLNSEDTYSLFEKQIEPIEKINGIVDILGSYNQICEFDIEEFKNYIISTYKNYIIRKGESIPLILNNICYKFTVVDFDFFVSSDKNYGLVTDILSIEIKKVGQNIKTINDSSTSQIFNKSFDFKDLDIGGLNDELTTIFRKVFVSRLLPSNVIEKLNLKHIKGLILYGPPGTGKTLIARQLSKSLKAKSIKIINGPELISSYVGKSEENVRNLFIEAENDMKVNDTGLHVIVFDEFDSLCKKRGETSGVSGDVNDKVVTQLLSKIDGVDALNNILLIGMTNRIDLLDSAILRPGRFEVHVEISLPDEKGRVEILNIHTKSLKENKCIDTSVNIDDIAKNTKNYTGAELEGLVRDARSYAINELVDIKNLNKKIELKDIVVTKSHFDRAISSYVPKFGTTELDINYYIPNGIIDYNGDFTSMKEELIENINKFTNNSKQLHSILLTGPTGSGKTAFSVWLAKQTNYPFIKVISNNDMIGYSENAKTHYIKEIFEQSYVSDIGVIVIDSIDTIVEYYRDTYGGGLRFMSSLYNSIKTLIKKIPTKKNHKLLVIINYDNMTEFNNCVDVHKEMPLIDEINTISSQF